jgi:hypothetical protein
MNALGMNAPAILFRVSFRGSPPRQNGLFSQGDSAERRFYPAAHGAYAAKIP